MTDDMSHGTGSPGDEHETWAEDTSGGSQGREWMTQLQTMIEQVATQAAPVIREVGAKAAELAAVAGEKAGPVAHRAAALTQEAGLKLAERSRAAAAELRRDAATGSGPAGSKPDSTDAGTPPPVG